MTRKWHDLLGLFLIVALFLIEIPRYANTLPDHEAPVAVGMGILLAGGAFYCVETWGMVKRSAPGTARIGWLAKMILVQIVLAPVIMTPQMAAQQLDVSVSEWLKNPLADPMLLLWTFVVTLAPVMVGGMVAFARSLQYSSDELKGDSEIKALRAKVRELTDMQSHMRALPSHDAAHGSNGASDNANGAAAYACECGETFETPQAYAAHKRWHCRMNAENAGNGKGEDEA